MRFEKNLFALLQNIVRKIIREVLDEFLDDNRTELLKLFEKSDPLQLLTVKDVSLLLQVSKPTVYRLMRSGGLKSTRFFLSKRTAIRFRRLDVEDFLARSSQ